MTVFFVELLFSLLDEFLRLKLDDLRLLRLRSLLLIGVVAMLMFALLMLAFVLPSLLLDKFDDIVLRTLGKRYVDCCRQVVNDGRGVDGWILNGRGSRMYSAGCVVEVIEAITEWA